MENWKKKQVRKPEDQIKRPNIQTIGIPEKENRDYTWKEIMNKIIQESFLLLKGPNVQ